MRRNDAGSGLSKVLIVVAVVAAISFIIAMVVLEYQSHARPDVELSGWVRNVNIVYDSTIVAVEKDGDITPQSYELIGKHSELWKGEHVWLRLHFRPYREEYEIVGFKRLGPDDKSRPLIVSH